MSKGTTIKYLIILIGFFLFSGQFFLMASWFLEIADESPVLKINKEQGKESKIEMIIKQVQAYREAEKFVEAEQLLNKSLKEFTKAEDQKDLQIELAEVHFVWATKLREKNDYSNTLRHLKGMYDIDKVYRPQNSAHDLNNIGVMYSELDLKHKALEYFEKALPICKKFKDRALEAAIIQNIGKVYYDKGQKQKALKYYEIALPISQGLGEKNSEAFILTNIGAVYFDFDQMSTALEYFEKALQINKQTDDRSLEYTITENIINVYYRIGKKSHSLEYYEKALIVSQKFVDLEVNIRNKMGIKYFELSQKEKALEYFEKALSISKKFKITEGEADSLNNIGRFYKTLGPKSKAIEYYQRALEVISNCGKSYLEAEILNNIGNYYSDFGEKSEALRYFDKALQISKDAKYPEIEALTLKNIGSVYSDLALKQEALGYYKKSLSLYRESVDQPEEKASILNNIGIINFKLGEMKEALNNFEEALLICRQINDPQTKSHTLTNIGFFYFDLGQHEKALTYYKEALTVQQTLGDWEGEACTLNNIGSLYEELKENQESIKYYEKSLSISTKFEYLFVQAKALNNIGKVYSEMGQIQKALEYYEKALFKKQEIGDRSGEAITLNNIGRIYDDLGQKQTALKYFEKALLLTKIINDKPEEAEILSNFMFIWDDFKAPLLSIFYGKQSVNGIQKIRFNISEFPESIKQSFTFSKKNIYRKLVTLLISEARLGEAQQVMDMLKENEFLDFIRRRSLYADDLSSQADFTKFEKQWIENYKTIINKISDISNEYHNLEFMDKGNTEKKKIIELDMKLKQSQIDYEEFLTQLKEAFEKHEKEIKDKLETTFVAQKVSELQSTLKYLDETGSGKNAALHYLVYGSRISVILTTPSSPPMVKYTPIDEKEFNLMILNYRILTEKLGEMNRGDVLVIKPNNNLEKLFQKKNEYERALYDVIFKAVDEELKRYGATDLMISLDGVLRYIPLPALWDGESYVVQRYRIALITPSSLKNIKDEPVNKKIILGMGASLGGKKFSPLYYVKQEISSIVRDEEKGYKGLIKGKAFIDKDFTKENMFGQLNSKQFNIVHISSHFKFSPGDEAKNLLLLGDGSTLKLSEIRGMGKLFEPVKLLVLSACQTGVGGGNGDEIDGFGELAQQSGAKCVIASLWPVADESTKDLMVAFYRIIKEGKAISKIEALRQAQLELAGLEDLLQKDKNHTDKESRQKTKYSNPYYWGPFILMGNWR